MGAFVQQSPQPVAGSTVRMSRAVARSDGNGVDSTPRADRLSPGALAYHRAGRHPHAEPDPSRAGSAHALQVSSHGMPAAAAAGLPLCEVERRHVLFALEQAKGNRKCAAECLGATRRTLYRMADRHGIRLSALQE
jgi:DNA-binding NtrC family response regulator